MKTFEHKLENRDVEDDEKWSKREEIWKAKISESDVALQAAENKVQLLSERLEVGVCDGVNFNDKVLTATNLIRPRYIL